MAHKIKENCITDVLEQARVGYSAIIVWKKDWEKWRDELLEAARQPGYDVLDEPLFFTKNQMIIAEKLAENVSAEGGHDG